MHQNFRPCYGDLNFILCICHSLLVIASIHVHLDDSHLLSVVDDTDVNTEVRYPHLPPLSMRSAIFASSLSWQVLSCGPQMHLLFSEQVMNMCFCNQTYQPKARMILPLLCIPQDTNTRPGIREQVSQCMMAPPPLKAPQSISKSVFHTNSSPNLQRPGKISEVQSSNLSQPSCLLLTMRRVNSATSSIQNHEEKQGWEKRVPRSEPGTASSNMD